MGKETRGSYYTFILHPLHILYWMGEIFLKQYKLAFFKIRSTLMDSHISSPYKEAPLLI